MKRISVIILSIIIGLMLMSCTGSPEYDNNNTDNDNTLTENTNITTNSEIEANENAVLTSITIYHLGQKINIDLDNQITQTFIDEFVLALKNCTEVYDITAEDDCSYYKNIKSGLELTYSEPTAFKTKATEKDIIGKKFLFTNDNGKYMIFSGIDKYETSPVGDAFSEALDTALQDYINTNIETATVNGAKVIIGGTEMAYFGPAEIDPADNTLYLQLMYRAFTFYQAIINQNYELINELASQEFQNELNKVLANGTDISLGAQLITGIQANHGDNTTLSIAYPDINAQYGDYKVLIQMNETTKIEIDFRIYDNNIDVCGINTVEQN